MTLLFDSLCNYEHMCVCYNNIKGYRVVLYIYIYIYILNERMILSVRMKRVRMTYLRYRENNGFQGTEKGTENEVK